MLIDLTTWRSTANTSNRTAMRYLSSQCYTLTNCFAKVDFLAKDMLIGVTKFFRDHEVWEGIKKRVIPQIVESCRNNTVRVWVVACSTGEEAYTVAMLFQEYKDISQRDFEVKVSILIF